MKSSLPPADEPAPLPPPAGPPRRRAREKEPRRRRGRGGVVVFLLASALPAAALAWFFLQPAARREEILAKLPPGVGGRAISAAIALGVLLLLARVALPAFHGSSGALRGLLQRMRARRGIVRVLLFPVEALLSLAWLVTQTLFAVDAFLVVVAGLVLILLVARIVKPDLLPDVLPQLTR